MNSENEMEDKYKFLGIWKAPSFIQKLHGPKFYVFLYSLLAIVLISFVAGVVVVNEPELEARFDLSKGDLEFIASGNNIGFCVVILFVSYFGEKYNKAKSVALGCLLFGLGCLVYSLPHFTTPLHVITNETDRFHIKCKPWRSPSCDVDQGLHYTLYVFFVSQLLIGASLTPFYSLGLNYLIQSVAKKHDGLFFGQINACINFGATIGILGGASVLRRVYVDFDKTNETPPLGDVLGQDKYIDSRWVGAWWVYPLIAMGASWLLFIVFLGFAKYLPGSYHNNDSYVDNLSDEKLSNTSIRSYDFSSFKDMFRALKELVTNPTLMFTILAGCIQYILVVGSGDFVAKYYESAYNMSSEDAGMTFGFIFALGAILGSMVGGIMMWVLNWNTKEVLRFCVVGMFLAAVFSPTYMLYCDNIQIAGITVSYGDSSKPSTVNLTSPCNAHCLCQEEIYVPACGSDNITYFSPCQAGCNRVVADYTYGSCDCVAENLDGLDRLQPALAVVDSCESDCKKKTYGLILSIFLVFFLSLGFSPYLVVAVRVVPPTLRSFSLGLQIFLFRCLGQIPSVRFFGFALSSACLLYSKDACTGKDGKCVFYNNKNVSIALMLINMIGSLIAAGFSLVALFAYKPSEISKRSSRKESEVSSRKSFSMLSESMESEETTTSTKF